MRANERTDALTFMSVPFFLSYGLCGMCGESLAPVTSVELLHLTGGVDHHILAGVERVAVAGHLHIDERVGVAVSQSMVGRFTALATSVDLVRKYLSAERS